MEVMRARWRAKPEKREIVMSASRSISAVAASAGFQSNTMRPLGGARKSAATLRRIAGCIPVICTAFWPSASHAETLDMATFAEIAQRCGSSVATSTLAAVAKTESGFRTLVVSDNTTHRGRSYDSIGAAALVAERLIAARHSVDIGLMQINSANLRRLRMTVRDALDACKSVSAGATILTQNYLSSHNGGDEQTALRDALSQYNTGNRRAGYRNGYVRRVEAAAEALASAIATGTVERVSRVSRVALRQAPFRVAGAGGNGGQEWWDVWRTMEHSLAPATTGRSATATIF